MDAKAFMQMNKARAQKNLDRHARNPRSHDAIASKVLMAFIEAYEAEVGFDASLPDPNVPQIGESFFDRKDAKQFCTVEWFGKKGIYNAKLQGMVTVYEPLRNCSMPYFDNRDEVLEQIKLILSTAETIVLRVTEESKFKHWLFNLVSIDGNVLHCESTTESEGGDVVIKRPFLLDEIALHVVLINGNPLYTDDVFNRKVNAEIKKHEAQS